MLRIGQIESTAQNNLYTDGNVAGGIAATRLRAAALNAIQEELAYIIENSGGTLSTSDTTQVLTTLKALFKTNASLTAIGIGQTVLSTTSAIDLQTFVFTTGANYIVSSSNLTNLPAGISFPASTGISVTVDYISTSATRIGLTLMVDTVTDASYNVYRILGVGSPGSRVWSVRQVYDSTDTIPLANGGTGATTQSGALTNFGLVANSDVSGAIGRLIKAQAITSSTTFTPQSATKFLHVQAIAPGGGSVGCPATSSSQTGGCPGGYHGQYIDIIIPVSAFGASVSITIGSPGSAGTGASGTATAGGNTSFGSIFTLGGGPAGGAGVVGSGALISGSQYLSGQTYSSTITPLKGTSNITRNPQFIQVTAGIATGYSPHLSPMEGGYYGSGAEGVYSAASSAQTAGFSGRAGIMIIEEYA